jgi:DNA invertase Pin-like site-specific DNA recombinase
MTTCALYARVSTKARPKAADCKTAVEYQARFAEWSKKHQDTLNQLAAQRTYAKAQAWKVVEFIDHETGKHADRAGLDALFLAASRREIDVVLVWALDRFTREGVAETFVHIKRLHDYGVEFESLTEPQFRTTGPAGELMIAISAWIAKQERVRISERTKAGLARVRAEGKHCGRPWKVFDRTAVVQLRGEGKSWSVIATELGVKISTARDAFKLCGNRPPKKTKPVRQIKGHS